MARGNEFLVDEIPPEWWRRENFGGVRARVFSSAHGSVSNQRLKNAMQVAISANTHPAVALACNIKNSIDMPEAELRTIYSDGRLGLIPCLQNITIHPGDYIIIMSPYDIQSNAIQDNRCEEAIISVRGGICALLGGSIAFTQSAVVDIPKDQNDGMATIAQSIIYPGLPDQFRFIEDATIDALNTGLKDEKDPLWRTRAETAFLFVGRSRDTSDPRMRFFELWTGLEVYSGGYNAVSGMINKEHSKPAWKEKMLTLKHKRRSLVHAGERHLITIEEEHLISATILELMCKRMKIQDSTLESYLRDGPEKKLDPGSKPGVTGDERRAGFKVGVI